MLRSLTKFKEFPLKFESAPFCPRGLVISQVHAEEVIENLHEKSNGPSSEP